MQAGFALFDFIDGVDENFIRVKRAVLHGQVEAHVILGDDPARADVHVSSLGISRLASSQPDRVATGLQMGIGITAKQIIPTRSRCKEDRVAVILAADAPPVQDDQQHASPSAPVMGGREGGAVHGGRLIHSQGGENRWGHIRQFAVAQFHGRGGAGIDQNELHQVGGMRNMRRPIWIVHLLQIAMIGGDHHHVIVRKGRIHDLAEMGIHGFRAPDLGLVVRGVADDVAVGKVGHDEIIFLFNAEHNLFGDLGKAQLGNLLEGDILRGGNANILLTLERLVVPAVEEEGDMREFFRFSGVQLTQTRAADDFSQRIANPGRREGHRQVFEFFVIKRQDDKVEILERGPREAVEVGRGEGFGQLDLALPAAAAKDDGVAVLDATKRYILIIHKHDRVERVVCLPLCI